MQAKLKLSYITYILLTLCISSCLCVNTSISNTSALSYQTQTGIKFTFNPTINISISSDLTISNLTPGTTSDSNNITVDVATNTSYGYTVSALANSTNLTHSNNANTFSGIATNANLENLITDNTWGYSYKNNLDSTPTWSNYNGLSTETSTTLFNTDNVANSSIDIKIAAKASNTQPSGAYTNTINFYAVAKPAPQTIDDLTYLQGFANLSPTDLTSVKNSMPTNYTYTLKDQRDGQEYTVAKLEDGKIWMTKNLNLAGGTEITGELSDVPANYTLPTANGFQEGNRLPASSQDGFSDNTMAYVYNTGNNTDNCASPGCYSYYSWHAATAGSGVDITTNNTDTPHSICPKGWKMPTSRNYVTTDSDFYNLAVAYGMNPSNKSDATTETGSNFYNRAGPNTIANFNMAGVVRNSAVGETNSFGYYWSSTSLSSVRAYYLMFRTDKVYSADNYDRFSGIPVRCLAR